MSDLLKELRESKNGWYGSCCEEAADEIERLRLQLVKAESWNWNMTPRAPI